MSHITNDAQRQENKEIDECPNSRVQEWGIVEEADGWYVLEDVYGWKTVNKCDFDWVDYTHDKCKICGKCLTY